MSDLKRMDSLHMQQALRLARDTWPSPNPRVGCVIVREGEVVGRGWHAKAGQPHAEIVALADAADAARGADMYVTLEPCCHQGRTGPCTRAIIQAGIRRVVVGCLDPNPVVSCKGVDELRAAGADVAVGVEQESCERLIRGHARFSRTGLPHVTHKYAMTLDGKVATASGLSKWITSPESRAQVHLMRQAADAVVTGIGTVLADDPKMNVRLDSPLHQPCRVVFDSRARLPLTSRMLRSDGGPVAVVVSERAEASSIRALEDSGAAVLRVAGQSVGAADAFRLLAAELGVREALLECGPTLAAAAYQEGVVSDIVCFMSGKLFGGIGAPGPIGGPGVKEPALAREARITAVRRFGPDIAIYASLD